MLFFPFYVIMEKIQIHEINEVAFPFCPVRNILARVGDKWSLLVLHELTKSQFPLRFSVIKKGIPDISQKILTSTLRMLEEDGYVYREVYAEVPPRVEYSLTSRGNSFIEVCRPVIQWAIDNLPEIMNDRKTNMGKK